MRVGQFKLLEMPETMNNVVKVTSAKFSFGNGLYEKHSLVIANTGRILSR